MLPVDSFRNLEAMTQKEIEVIFFLISEGILNIAKNQKLITDTMGL